MNNKNISETLNFILTLQKNSCCDDGCCPDGCTRPFLGPVTTEICFNTRPITFYRCDNSLITLPYANGETSIFRVESVKDNSVRVLLLASNDDGTYTNTNTYATINLGCVCAIRCLADTYLTTV